MPNWSYCEYRVTGKRKHLRNLNSILNKLDKRKTPLVENGFGKLWLGCLVSALGGNWKEIPCRGEIHDYNLTDDYLSICFEVAWSEKSELRTFIENYYNDEIKIWFCEEEPGLEVYASNNLDYFGYRYKIDGEREPFPKYYNDIDEAAEDLGRYIEKHIIQPNEESIEKAIEEYLENREDEWLSFHKFYEFN